MPESPASTPSSDRRSDYDLFLSHASADAVQTERIRRELQRFRSPDRLFGRRLECHHYHHDESQHHDKRHNDCYDHEEQNSSKLRDILAIDGVPLLFLMYFLTFFGFSFFYSGLPILASSSLGWDSGALGVFFALCSISAAC